MKNKYYKQEKFRPLNDSAKILQEKKIAIIGIGGLGSHSSEYVARMGIGTIILIDDDIVEESNLPRQGLFGQSDSDNKRFKVDVAKEVLKNTNPDVSIVAHNERINSENIDTLLKGVDLVLDGTDNMTTRYLINDYCFENNIPWVYASATASVGTIINFIPGKTPCFRCYFGEVEEDDASCDINGVILPTLTMITSLQVTEALKILLDKEPSLEEIRYNVWTREETSMDITSFIEEGCQCQTKITKKGEAKYYMICSGDSIQVNTNLSFDELKGLLNEMIIHHRFLPNKMNSGIVEIYRGTDDRVVAFNSGKLVFHNVSKEEIKQMLE